MKLPKTLPHHDGATYDPDLDQKRLNGQQRRVFVVMKDGHWRTLAEITEITGDPESSVSARLRDLRKEKFGGFRVNRRRRGIGRRGLFEYLLLPPLSPGQTAFSFAGKEEDDD